MRTSHRPATPAEKPQDRLIADDLNPEANDALKESYKFITGEDYTTVEAAQK